MPQSIPNLPAELVGAPGVEMNPPPAQFLEMTNTIIKDAAAQMRPEDKAVLTWIATRDGSGRISTNLAAVARLGDTGQFEITAYIGKTWGTPVSAGIVTGVAGAWHFGK